MGIKKKLKDFGKLKFKDKVKVVASKVDNIAPGLEKVAAARVGMTNPTGTGTSPLGYEGGTDKVIISQLSKEGQDIVNKLEKLEKSKPGEYIG